MIVRTLIAAICAILILPAVSFAQENCMNGVDDNNNGRIDCADQACKQLWMCQPIPEQCMNGLDDDGDGRVDCADLDCERTFACAPRAENCANGLDDDGNGDVDCADQACLGRSVCISKAEICSSGADEDGDGDIGCNDSDCAFLPQCLSCQAKPIELQGLEATRREVEIFQRPELIKRPEFKEFRELQTIPEKD